MKRQNLSIFYIDDPIFSHAEFFIKQSLEAEIEALVNERQEARASRNFARSDEIRDELAARGIILEDTKDGVRWKRK